MGWESHSLADLDLRARHGAGGAGLALRQTSLEMVAKDVLNGIVSVKSAREDYGVILDAQGNIDIGKTDQKRQSQAKD